MSARSKALLILSGLVLTGFALVVTDTVSFSMGEPVRDGGGPSDQELEALRSLPYVTWGEDEAPDLSGVVVDERAAYQPGYNLYTNDVDEAYVLDMSGRVLHTWTAPEGYSHCEHVELLEDGEVLLVCEGKGIVKLDSHSRLVWEQRLRVHHDVAVLPDGSLAIPVGEPLREYQGRNVRFDAIVFLSADGQVQGQWSTYEHLEELRRYHRPSRLDSGGWVDEEDTRANPRFDYYHTNSLEVLPETSLGEEDPRFRAGNYLICLRNVNLLVILDQATLEVVWAWGAEELDFPHMPTMLESGNILIFDNGASRDYSRIIEVAPKSGEIVWEYRATPEQAFYSRWRGSSQRLANGNTLICESERGRVFEIDPDQKIVWEFWNPAMKEIRAQGLLGRLGLKKEKKRGRIYRFNRVGAERLGWLLGADTG